MAEGRTDADRYKEIEAKKPGSAAEYDPAARGNVGGQSGGKAYDGETADHGGTFGGGQSNQGYYGDGRMGADTFGEGDSKGHSGSTQGSSDDKSD